MSNSEGADRHQCTPRAGQGVWNLRIVIAGYPDCLNTARKLRQGLFGGWVHACIGVDIVEAIAKR